MEVGSEINILIILIDRFVIPKRLVKEIFVDETYFVKDR
jgi:hypothetical protein